MSRHEAIERFISLTVTSYNVHVKEKKEGFIDRIITGEKCIGLFISEFRL